MDEQPRQGLRRWLVGWIAVATVPVLLTFLPSGLVLRGLPFCIPGLVIGFALAWLLLRRRTKGRFPRFLSLAVAYAFGAGPLIALLLTGRTGNDLILPMHLGPFAAVLEGSHIFSHVVFALLAVGLVVAGTGSVIKPTAAWVLLLAPLIYLWCLTGLAWLERSV